MKKTVTYILFLTIMLVGQSSLKAEIVPSILIENFRLPLLASRAGFVKIHVKEGQQVEAGQVLFELDVEQIKLELKAADLKYQKALLKYQRKEKELELEGLLFNQKTRLFEAGGMSRDAYKIVVTQYEMGMHPEKGKDLVIVRTETEEAKLNLDRINQQLASATRLAPSNGQITKLYVVDKQWISAGQKVMDMLSINPLNIVLQLPLKQLVQLQAGMTLKVKIETAGGLVDVTGNIDYIIDELDSLDQVGKINLKIDNEERRYRPGMRVKVELP